MNQPAMRNTMHATLERGGYRYVYEDGTGYRCTVEAKERRGPERQWWTHDLLPNREFSAFKEVSATIDATMPDDLIREAGKHPFISESHTDTCNNACRLCPRQPYTVERVKHDTTRYIIATSWQGFHGASLCAAHSAEFGNDARKLLAALEAEVAARNARRAAKLAAHDTAPGAPKGEAL